MPDVIITCDRCHKPTEGAEYHDGTSGFYRSSHTGGPWDKYMELDEFVLCDDCMARDPRYQADYWLYRSTEPAKE